ncbi:MAG TPA: hypothetical protein PLF88_08635 [Opitutaceae bacterium]|nr:hypothetical protein [Opitutaceae bacterium]HRJ48597.1 hypothetical protein [Opitutaceae bacterium]
MSPAIFRREGLRVILLAAAAALIWMTAANRWTATDWATPAAYNVDALETLARFQVSAEQGAGLIWSPEIGRLGAPWAADWSAYPLPDAPWYWLAGRLVNLLGLIPASNVMLLLAHVCAVLAFYLCARALRHRPVIAIGAALIFGFCHSIFHRGLSHHSFALAFSVPPALLVAWWIGGGRQLWTKRSYWIATGGIAAVIGAASPYFVFFFFQLLALALAYQWFTARRRNNLLAGATAFVICLAVFALFNAASLHAALTSTQPAALARNYAGTEVYGLKPIELLLPPDTHRWGVAADLGRTYGSFTQLPGEISAPYQGIIGIGALILMFGAFAGRLLRGQAGLRTAHAPLGLWIIGFAMVGGLNSLFAFGGLDHFRAGNRYSIHLLALALFFAGGWASRITRPWPTARVCALVLPLVLLGLWDQMPKRPSAVTRAALHAAAIADRTAGNYLEAQLPPGAQIFQLPATVFPEAGPRGGMSDYEHLRLFLGTSTLRFAHGALAGSTAQFWTAHAATLPSPALIEELEGAGFAALLIDRRAYPQDAADLIRGLQSAGYPAAALPGRPELCLIRLHPSAQPALPDLTRMAIRPLWDPAGTPGAVSLHALAGWFTPEVGNGHRWRWAGSHATLGIANETDAPCTVVLSGRVHAVSAGQLMLRLNGREIRRYDLPRGESVELGDRELPLPAGPSLLELRFDGRLTRARGDPRELGFQATDLALEFVR